MEKRDLKTSDKPEMFLKFFNRKKLFIYSRIVNSKSKSQSNPNND